MKMVWIISLIVLVLVVGSILIFGDGELPYSPKGGPAEGLPEGDSNIVDPKDLIGGGPPKGGIGEGGGDPIYCGSKVCFCCRGR